MESLVGVPLFCYYIRNDVKKVEHPMVYTTSEIAERIKSVAIEFNIPAVYMFGSYARGQAAEESDIDSITVGTLQQTAQMESNADFRDAVMREKVLIYQS